MSNEPATSTPNTDPNDEQAALPVSPGVADTHSQDDKTAGQPNHPVEHETPHEHEPAAPPGAEEATAMTEVVVPLSATVSEDLVPDHEHTPTEPEINPALAPESAPETLEADESTPKAAKKSRRAKSPKTATTAAVEPVAEPQPARETEPVATTPSESVEPTGPPVGPPAEPVVENKKKWYAIKVQSGREDSIKAAILRKVRIEGLEEFFGRIEIPFEEVSEKKSVKVKDKKTGETSYQEKKVTRKKKKFQGYLFAELEFNDRILYLFRETSGVGDFLNLRQKPGLPPTPEPMPDHEVQSMLTGVAVRNPNLKVKVKLDFEKGDKVRIREGSFANSEGEVKAIIEAKDPNEAPKVMVVLTFWGRPLDVELDSSQVEKV